MYIRKVGDLMRVFIGIELENIVKEYLFKVQNTIKSFMYKGEMTNFNNFHLTLKYIGHVTDEEIDILKQCIFSATDAIDPFDMKLNGLHSFSKGKSSILWIGIESGKQKLNALYKAINNQLIAEEFDLEYNRKYRPHITIGKKVMLSPTSTMEVLPHYYDVVRVKAITLFHSHRVNDVLTYTPIYRCDL